MAKITLSENTFQIVPEGTHIFKITKVEYKPDFGKLIITMETKQGFVHTERYSFIKSNGENNDVAQGIFSFFAKTALQDYELEEIDHTDLVGRFIKCEVTHDKVPNKNTGAIMTFSRLGNKAMANGFDDDGEEEVVTTKKPTPVVSPAAKKVDLSSILGKK